MNRWIRFAAAGLVLAVAACGDSSPDSPLAPGSARFDSGPIVGGNKTGQDTVYVASSASDTTDNSRSGPIVSGN